MTNQEAKVLIKRTMPKGNSAIDIQLRGALELSISAIGAIEQFRWERDVAIAQLEELGLSLGHKVDHVKNAIEFTEKVKELWKDYTSKSNTVDLVNGLDELISN